MGTGGLSWRSFAIQYWSRSNRRSHRRTRWASGASCLQSKASTTLSLACAPTAPNSSARWPSTRTGTDSATCEALRASSSRWPRNSSEAFTAFGETSGALGAPSTRSHGSQPSCFLAYLRRGFVRRTLVDTGKGDSVTAPEDVGSRPLMECLTAWCDASRPARDILALRVSVAECAHLARELGAFPAGRDAEIGI